MNEAISSPSSVSLRPVTADDGSLLLAIYRSTRAEELALVSWWSDDQKAAFVQMQLEAQHAHYRNTFPQAEYSVVMVHDRAVGRLYTAEMENELRILDLTLLPEERNAGIGTGILTQLLQACESQQKALSIHVESFNPSIGLLERLGFRKVSENGFYFLMQHAAGGAPTA